MTAIPDYVKKILHMLTGAGYEAYIVGGAVRDLLLKLPPGDFDITTSATPEEISAVFRANNIKTIDNLGQNFGCVVAVIDGVPAEITTFRGESYGTDAHKPEKVWFSKSLREDLSRRDFTVNAMAMDINGRIYDYHNGMEDLQSHGRFTEPYSAHCRRRRTALQRRRTAYAARLPFCCPAWL